MLKVSSKLSFQSNVNVNVGYHPLTLAPLSRGRNLTIPQQRWACRVITKVSNNLLLRSLPGYHPEQTLHQCACDNMFNQPTNHAGLSPGDIMPLSRGNPNMNLRLMPLSRGRNKNFNLFLTSKLPLPEACRVITRKETSNNNKQILILMLMSYMFMFMFMLT
ncbi:hypothetical protein PoB_003871100 [Plakobranchus ocellatus]|uniref:Uncharacterized protein n=1 Tax=Plakobranchus ocellatus TaxID=259542 RepID=A0AAV4AM17_9GAST|nr:hypothetical protein PoB_003871100 [Plakobranchus ocellatus]